MTDTKTQIYKAQRTLSRINSKKATLRCIMFKRQETKSKEKILKDDQVPSGSGTKNTSPVEEKGYELQ